MADHSSSDVSLSPAMAAQDVSGLPEPAAPAPETNPFVLGLPAEVQHKVSELRVLDEQQRNIDLWYQEQQRLLMISYQERCDPMALQRRAVLGADDQEVGVPGFWGTVFANSQCTSPHIHSEKDKTALTYLSDVRCVVAADAHSFTLEFDFLINPFFDNRTLSKHYTMEDDEPCEIDPDLTEGCTIDWKAGKNITVKIKKKKGSGKKGMAPITKAEPCESFFNFFKPPKPDPEDLVEMSMEEIEQIEDRMQEDAELGHELRFNLIPHAVKYFVGEGSSDEDSDEDDDDDDDDSPIGAAGDNNNSGDPADQPECKQQ